MEIKHIKRQFEKKYKQGTRYSKDPFYASKEWKLTRGSFLASEPIIQLPALHSIPYANKYCVECWKEGNIVNTYAVDHIQRKKAQGEWTNHANLQGLCKHHHAVKSANESNETKKI